MKAKYPMRTTPIYNNIMYALAGRVAEKLGASTWEDLVSEEILKPLGMNNTRFYHDRGDLKERYAVPYVHHNGQRFRLPEKMMKMCVFINKLVIIELGPEQLFYRKKQYSKNVK